MQEKIGGGGAEVPYSDRSVFWQLADWPAGVCGSVVSLIADEASMRRAFKKNFHREEHPKPTLAIILWWPHAVHKLFPNWVDYLWATVGKRWRDRAGCHDGTRGFAEEWRDGKNLCRWLVGHEWVRLGKSKQVNKWHEEVNKSEWKTVEGNCLLHNVFNTSSNRSLLWQTDTSCSHFTSLFPLTSVYRQILSATLQQAPYYR